MSREIFIPGLQHHLDIEALETSDMWRARRHNNAENEYDQAVGGVTIARRAVKEEEALKEAGKNISPSLNGFTGTSLVANQAAAMRAGREVSETNNMLQEDLQEKHILEFELEKVK